MLIMQGYKNMKTYKILFSTLVYFFLSVPIKASEIDFNDSLSERFWFAYNLMKDMRNTSESSRERFNRIEFECDDSDEKCGNPHEYVLDLLRINFADIEPEQQNSLLPVWNAIVEDALNEGDVELLKILKTSFVDKGWGGICEDRDLLVAYHPIWRSFSENYRQQLQTSNKHLVVLSHGLVQDLVFLGGITACAPIL